MVKEKNNNNVVESSILVFIGGFIHDNIFPVSHDALQSAQNASTPLRQIAPQ